jgi:hypothetical protein
VPLLSLTAILTAFGLTSCGLGATKHYLQTPGQTGFVTRTTVIKGLMPNDKGELVEGDITIQPGTLIRNPKNTQEAMDALKAAGAKFEDPGVPAK